MNTKNLKSGSSTLNKLFDRLKRYPQTYSILSLISKHYRDNVAIAGTSLVIEGYPRCGNSFLTELLRLKLPQQIRLSQHIHRIGNLELARRNQIPSAILFRDPYEAIPSTALRVDRRELGVLVEYYIDFYSWVLDNLVEQALIIQADDLFEYPDGVVRLVLEHSGFLSYYDAVSIDDIKNARIKLDRFNEMNHGGDPLRVSYPNQQKDEAKQLLQAELKEVGAYQECVSIFEQLKREKSNPCL